MLNDHSVVFWRAGSWAMLQDPVLAHLIQYFINKTQKPLLAGRARRNIKHIGFITSLKIISMDHLCTEMCGHFGRMFIKVVERHAPRY